MSTPTSTPAPTGTPAPRTRRATAPWLVVALREIVVRLTNKTFIVSTLVMVALIAGSLGLQAFVATRDDTLRVVATEPAGADLARRVGTAAHAADSHAYVKVEQVLDAATAEARLRSDDADAYLKRTPSGWQVVAHKEASDSFVATTRTVVREQALAENARRAGTSVPELTKGADVTARALDTSTSDEKRALGMGLSAIFGLLLWMSALTFGMQIASSIVEEKASRVVEIVAAAIPVRQLLAGKVLGNTVMAVGQIVLFVAVGLVGVSFTSFSGYLPTVAASSGWFVVFFLAGFLALACLWALAGALATRSEDLQSTTAPLTTILMVAYMAGFLAKGTWMTVLSYVPVVSTVLMPVRLFTGEASWWEAIVALALTVAFAVVAVLFSERLYRRSLLQTQGKLSIRQAMALED